MARAIDSQASAITAPEVRSASRLGRSRWLPRFGIRTLLIAGIISCLLFGWVGRGLYRVRQEDAAIEAILKAGGTYGLGVVPGEKEPRDLGGSSLDSPFGTGAGPMTLRAIGWRRRPPVERIALDVRDPQGPAAERALAALVVFPEIEYVNLAGQAFDDPAIQALGRLPNLKGLCLHDTAVTGQGLAKLPAPERLQSLEIYEPPMESDLLSGVGALTELRRLDLYQAHGTRKDHVAAIASLRNLTHFGVHDSILGDWGAFAPLAEHPKIVMVHIDSPSLDREDIAALASLPNLETLYVWGAGDDDLTTLAQAPRLRTLGLNCSVSRDAARRLSDERPELVVLWTTGPASPSETFRAGVSDAASQPPAR